MNDNPVSARLDAIMRYYRAASGSEPALTERMELRLEPALKEWILTNGGAAMLRDVMRTLKAEGEGEP